MSSPEPPLSWTRRIESNSEEELAAAILVRLDLQSKERLLDLQEADRRALLEHHRALARSEASEQGLEEIEAPDLENDLRLAESCLERAGQFALAAVVYALGHDDVFDHFDASAGDVANFRVFLRFKLGHVLWLMDEEKEENIQRCASFGSLTLQLHSELWGRIPKESFFSLRAMLNSWLGRRWKSIGEYRLAETAFAQASIDADNPDGRIANLVLACLAKKELGEVQAAYELLTLAREDLEECEDEVAIGLWESAYANLRRELGGDSALDNHRFATRGLARQGEILDLMWQYSPGEVDLGMLQPLVNLADQWLEDSSLEDPRGMHSSLVHLAFLIEAIESGNSETVRLLERARLLEGRFNDPAQKIQRQQLDARLRLQAGDVAGSLAIFSRAAAAGSHLEPANRLEFSGYYLEALARRAQDHDLVIDNLVDRIVSDFTTELARQPGSAARRQVRELHQRVLETAVLALLAVAHEADDEQKAQGELRRAWTVIATGRNVELEHPAQTDFNRDILAECRQLERALHSALRGQLVGGSRKEGACIEPLRRLREFELGIRRDSRSVTQTAVEPPRTGVGLMIFQVRDLLSPSIWVVLSSFEGRLSSHTVSAEDGFESRLKEWAAPFFEAADFQTRSVRVRRAAIPRKRLAVAPRLRELLPPFFAPLWLSRLGFRGSRQSPADTPSPVSSDVWHLFTDSSLGSIPLEMLPEDTGEETRFGQNRSVVYALRNEAPDKIHDPVGFGRGWLGLGGIPSVGAIPELPGSEVEVHRIERLLTAKGHLARSLIGPEANVGLLCRELAADRPAVLHFAAHGFADATYPELCTLVLADCADRPECELLPFLRISDLPLEGVELVVLSACSTLIGRSGRGTTMEGLAWAFLRAGVTQVIASRYPIDDRATSRWMIVLYEQLLKHSPAFALGRTRDICLVEHGFDPREVAAWSIWC